MQATGYAGGHDSIDRTVDELDEKTRARNDRIANSERRDRRRYEAEQYQRNQEQWEYENRPSSTPFPEFPTLPGNVVR